MDVRVFDKKVAQARSLTCALLPHLAGLVHQVEVSSCEHVPTAGIFASGRLVINAAWWETLAPREAAFVFAHELMHLLLQSHARDDGRDPWLFNIAHDYIINDTLRQTFGEVLAGGLDWPGARHSPVEALYHTFGARADRVRLWSSALQDPFEEVGAMAGALAGAGLVAASTQEERRQKRADVLDDTLERVWFEGVTRTVQLDRARTIEPLRARAAARQTARELATRLGTQTGQGLDPGHGSWTLRALRAQHVPPWERVLQRWCDDRATKRRSWSRASRRGPYPHGVARPGKVREGWTLHIVLDTSGSMFGVLEAALGRIATFAQASGVARVHLVQCDSRITSDEWVEPEALEAFEVRGLGGSDMSPAMLHLAQDPEVEAVLILTDGLISYPPSPMPYHVLWGLTFAWSQFNPSYGQVLRL